MNKEELKSLVAQQSATLAAAIDSLDGDSQPTVDPLQAQLDAANAKVIDLQAKLDEASAKIAKALEDAKVFEADLGA